MKNHLLLLVLLQINFTAVAQSIAEPLKTFCLGNSKSQFENSLSPEFKIMFDSIILEEKIDISACELLKFDDYIGIYKTQRLDEKVYFYINFKKDKGKTNKYIHYSFNCCESSPKNKLLFIYFKSEQSDYEELIMYYIQ